MSDLVLLRRAFETAALVFALYACTTAPPKPLSIAYPPAAISLLPRPAQWRELPGWGEDNLAQAWPAFTNSCAALAAQPGWQAPCAGASALESRSDNAVRDFFESNFTLYALVRSDDHAGLVTGYYEPLLEGSRLRSETYRIPLYRPPDDLLTIELGEAYPELKNMRLRGRLVGHKVLPYWSRSDIDAGRGPLPVQAIAWVRDPVEAFFLEVQGSGRLRLEDGTVIRLSYADQNGRPYRSIGRILVDRGDLPLEKASMQGIRDWGNQNPQRLTELLEENPSYVFFRELAIPIGGADGPPGALATPLTAGRSIAVDPSYLPLGAPVFLSTTWPNSTRELARLVFAQDTGGAIRGPLRADFFWGSGDDAAAYAGRMKQPARLWLLWPKGIPLPNLPGFAKISAETK